MKRDAKNGEAKICEAALRLASQKGWSGLTLEQIAKAAKIPPAQLQKQFGSKNRIIPALIRYIDGQTLAACGKGDPRTPPHDRLFEIFMARFDILQKHRKGILAIIQACRADSALACLILPAHWRSMDMALEAARLKVADGRNTALALGLLGVYYRVLWVWQTDTSADISKTMAALDQSLRIAGRLSAILFRHV